MAWNDEADRLRQGPARRAIDMAPVSQAIDEGVDSYGDAAEAGGRRIASMTSTATRGSAPSPQFEPAEFAINQRTGEIALPNGEVIKANAPLILQLATLQSEDGRPLPTMSADKMESLRQKGFRPYSQTAMRTTVEGIPTESAFWGEAIAAGKGTLGLMASAVDAMIGNDDPSNSWSRAQEAYAESQTIGEAKASQGRWYSGWDSFLSGLGQTVGNIGGTVVGAVPVAAGTAAAGAISGAGVGAIPGGAFGAGLAVSGFGAGFGEQATEFYESAVEAMGKMSPDQLREESPIYREILAENPDMDHEEAVREIAIRGARVAGATGGAIGAAEGLVGGRLAANLLGRMGFSRALLGRGADAVEKSPGRLAAAGRFAGRAGVAGAASGASEMAESMLGQSAGAQATGIGSTDPMSYASADEFWQGTLSGILLGGLGGRARRAPGALETGELQNSTTGSDVAAGFQQSPDTNSAWSQSAQVPDGALDGPAALQRRGGINQFTPSAPIPRDPATQPAYERRGITDFASGQRQMVLDGEGQAPVAPQGQQAPLAEPQQADMLGDVDPRQQDMLAPQAPPQAAQGGPVVDPAQQDLIPPVGPPTRPMGLRDRRAAQEAQLAERAAASEQDPAALGGPESATLEQQILDADDAIQMVEEQIAARPARDPAKKHLRAEAKRLKQLLKDLEAQWVEVKQTEGSQSGVSADVAVPQQVDAPEPANASNERTPDGRPVGVAPAPLVNPEPMSEGEAQSRAQSQAERGGAPADAAAVQAAARQSEQQVSPSTPEPAQDLAAQVEAMADPATDRDAVFVAEGNEAAMPAQLPDGAIVVKRRGIGTLITTSNTKAQQFRRAKKDADIAKILGYSEDKSAVIGNGAEPVVVQAQTPDGAVAAEQIATPAKKGAAAKAVSKQARKGARVVETTVAKAQERRAAAKQAPKAAAAVTVSRERATKKAPAKKPARKKAQDDDRTPAKQETADAPPARSTPRTPDPAPAPSATADTIERAATRKPRKVEIKGQTTALPTRLTTTTGRRGASVDMRVEAIDELTLLQMTSALEGGKIPAADRAAVEEVLRDFDQLRTMVDASVKAAEARLQARYESEPDGGTMLREYEQRQLEKENRGKAGEKGRRRTVAKDSPLYYLPLLRSETQDFMRRVRAEAKAEMGSYAPAQSVLRQLVGAIRPEWAATMDNAAQGKRVAQTLAALTDAQLEEVIEGTHERVRDSVVAKQAVRGATEVARAKRIADGDASAASDVAGDGNRFTSAREADHRIDGVDATPMTHVTAHGALPKGVRDVVNSWVQAFERGGNKFSAPVHVMSLADAMAAFPERFPGARVPNGKFLAITDAKGKPTSYVIAVDWQKFSSPEVATEILAHEFGHVVSLEVYARSDPRSRAAIDKAFSAWRERHRGKDMGSLLLSEMLPAERRVFERQNISPPEAYVTDFFEWSARNAAMYIMDPNRPLLGAVDRFLKKVADALRAIYAQITGVPSPDASWAEALDRWAAGTMVVGRMPAIGPQSYNHDAFDGPSEPQAQATVNLIARQNTSTLGALRGIMSGQTTVADVRAATNETVDTVLKGQPRDWARRLQFGLMTLRQLERKFRDTPIGKHLTAWVRAQQLKAKTANSMMEGASRWMEQANMLDAKVRATLERVMHDATHFNAHPEVPFNDPKNAHLSAAGLSARVIAVNEKRYNGVRDLYNAAVRADPKVAEVYAGLRDQFVGLRTTTLTKQKELVDDLNISQAAKDQLIARIDSALGQIREGPYFPLMRFGRWIVKVQLPARVIGKDGTEAGEFFDSKSSAREAMRNQRALNPGSRVSIEAVEGDPGKYLVRVYQSGVYFFENEAQATAAQDQILADVKANYEAMGVSYDEAAAAVESEDIDGATNTSIIGKPFIAADDYNANRQPPAQFMAEIHALLKDKAIDPELAAGIERLAAETLPENNYRQSLLPRQNVFGASQHMLRAYAHRFQGAAHHYSTVEHGRVISRAWEGMRKAARAEGFAQGDEVMNTLWSQQEALRARTKTGLFNTMSNVVTDASSLYSLGFSPAYVLMNSMQPWLVTAPVMAGYVSPSGKAVGMAKSARALKDAYEGAAGFFTKRGINDFINEGRALAGAKGTRPSLQETSREILDTFAKTDDEKAMLRDLLERGTLDFAWLNSLEDAMRGGVAGQKWANLQRLGMAFPQQIEAMNRVVTALAAYRLAKSEKLTDGSFAALAEFADDIVADTQLDYSRQNRPLAFNLPGLNVILQFKLYMQGMYMLMARSGAQALARRPQRRENETDEALAGRVKAWQDARTQGRRTFAYMMAAHAGAAGAAGLGPVSSLAKLSLVAFAAMTGDEDDEWKSGDQLLREMLTDLMGERAGHVAERGLPVLIGADLSDRVGLPVLADDRFAQIRESDTATTRLDKWVLYSLGAPYSNARRILGGVGDAANGDFAAAAKGLPAGVRAMATSARWAKEGVVDRNGDTFIGRDQLGWNDITLQALGVSPATTTRAYSERSEIKQTTAKILEDRKKLLQKDRTGKDVREEIRLFNATVPRPFRIDSEDRERSRTSKAAREKGEASKQEASVRKMLDG